MPSSGQESGKMAVKTLAKRPREESAVGGQESGKMAVKTLAMRPRKGSVKKPPRTPGFKRQH